MQFFGFLFWLFSILLPDSALIWIGKRGGQGSNAEFVIALCFALIEQERYALSDTIVNQALASLLELDQFDYAILFDQIGLRMSNAQRGELISLYLDVFIKSKIGQSDYSDIDALCAAADAAHRRRISDLANSNSLSSLKKKIYHLKKLWESNLPVPYRFDNKTSVERIESKQTQLREIADQLISSLEDAISRKKEPALMLDLENYSEMIAIVMQGLGNGELADSYRRRANQFKGVNRQ